MQSDEEHIRLTTNQSSEIIKMEQFISRPGSSFPCLQLQVVAHLHERLAVFNQKVHGDSGVDEFLQNSPIHEFQE